jgi:hypothetical protein
MVKQFSSLLEAGQDAIERGITTEVISSANGISALIRDIIAH